MPDFSAAVAANERALSGAARSPMHALCRSLAALPCPFCSRYFSFCCAQSAAQTASKAWQPQPPQRRPAAGLPRLPTAPPASPCPLTARPRNAARRWPSRPARRAKEALQLPQVAWEPSAWSRRPRASRWTGLGRRSRLGRRPASEGGWWAACAAASAAFYERCHFTSSLHVPPTNSLQAPMELT